MEKAQITFAEFMTEKMYTESFLFKISEIKSLKKGIKETRKSLDRGYQIDHAGKKYYWNDIFRSNPNGKRMVRAYETKEEWIAAEQEWIRYAEEEISMEETEIRGYWDEYMEYAESEDLDMKKEMKAFAKKAKKTMKMINALKKQLGGCENCPLEKICPEDRNNDFMNKCTDIWFQFFNSKDMVTFYEPMILW